MAELVDELNAMEGGTRVSDTPDPVVPDDEPPADEPDDE